MNTTRLSLIQRIQSNEEQAWTRLNNLYKPLIFRWLHSHALSPQDAEDLGQEIMMLVFDKISEFDYNGRRGAFRHWLRLITINRMKGFLRSRRTQRQETGDADLWETLEQLEAPDSEASQAFDRQHDQHVISQLLLQLAKEFSPRTIQAFRLYVLEETPPEEVAQRLGISVASVYSARSRILRRLREESQELLPEDISMLAGDR